MFKWLFLISLSLSELCVGQTSQHIAQVAPHLSALKVKRYAKIIDRETKKHGLDPRIVVAIIRQESGFRQVSTKRLTIDRLHGFVEEWFDIGITQINLGTALSYKLDIERLLVDDEYQIVAGVKILADKVKMCAHLQDAAFTCYHSTTEQHRITYEQHVRRYL